MTTSLRERLIASLAKSASAVQSVSSVPPVEGAIEKAIPPRSPRKEKPKVKTREGPTPGKKKKQDQPQRLLKKLPQAKVLGDANLEDLIKDNDVVVLMEGNEGDDLLTSVDASVAEERFGLKQSVLKSAMKGSGHKLSKKVMFTGGNVEGKEVTAIYLYESVHLDAPWQVKYRPSHGMKKQPMIAVPTVEPFAFRAC
eukprot:Blabericola_migrator_1__7947@NODE_4076_length_1344_cov_196_195771_g2516_i0_p1_GENE_NODE_4076_length_1344_cov_196_195771_g2516_i0NODE_4076_length_1344_cov_196_195771_g2516_i0_p1_ORF_typecomplete_len197_score43_34_NODE_4076_length_1344_cov_196_195771_g2516_i0110700